MPEIIFCAMVTSGNPEGSTAATAAAPSESQIGAPMIASTKNTIKAVTTIVSPPIASPA